MSCIHSAVVMQYPESTFLVHLSFLIAHVFIFLSLSQASRAYVFYFSTHLFQLIVLMTNDVALMTQS